MTKGLMEIKELVVIDSFPCEIADFGVVSNEMGEVESKEIVSNETFESKCSIMENLEGVTTGRNQTLFFGNQNSRTDEVDNKIGNKEEVGKLNEGVSPGKNHFAISFDREICSIFPSTYVFTVTFL